MSWCLQATHSPALPFSPKITSCGRYGGHINYFYPITAHTWVHANGSSHSHHLHQSWLRTVTSIPGAHYACTWHHSIKGQLCLALCSLFGWTRLQYHLDLKLETSPWHSPDCRFTWHTLVNSLFNSQLTSVDSLTSRSWWPHANLSYHLYGKPP